VNKDEDLNLFSEDITYHEMVQCSKAGCSENYQPIISRCQNCKAKLKSSFARKDWVPPVGIWKFVIDDMVSDHISDGLYEFKRLLHRRVTTVIITRGSYMYWPMHLPPYR
jgi:hypothetical protein